MWSNSRHGDQVQSGFDAGRRPRPDSITRSDAADLDLRRARVRRTISASVFATILGVGIVALAANPADVFPLIPIALIALGGINGAISTTGVLRIVGEQRMRRALASTPATGHGFDQTNGLVDLGSDAPVDATGEADGARRISSMNAAGIAYGNGTR